MSWTYLVLNVSLLVLVKMHLEQPGAIETETNPLSDDFGRVDEVVQNRTMNSHERAAARTLLLLLVHLTGGLGQDPPLGDEDHVLAGELLLQLADQPGLDLLEGLELRHRHENDNSLLALADLDLLGGRDVELTEVALQVRVHLEVEKSLRDGLFEIIGSLGVRLYDLSAPRHL